jgi:type IV pilus assembly protein PilC
MPRYQYEGRDTRGKKKGVIVASSKRDALLKLREQQIRVTEIAEVPENIWTKEIVIGSPVKLQHFVIFLRQFSTLLRAGVTVVEATNILAAQTESKALKKALLEMEQDVRQGHPLSEACAKQKRIFEPLFINMVKAGEMSGNLDDTLERLGNHYEKQYQMRQKVQSALAYPIIVGTLAIGVVLFLLVAVVPTFVSMFEDFGGELPAITKFVLKSSEIMQTYWYLVLLTVGVITIVFAVLKKFDRTRRYLDYVLLRIPVFGGMLQKAAIARMTRTLSSLVTSSVPILQALTMVEKVVGNEVIAKVIRDARKSLEQGSSLTVPLKRHWVFPPLVTHMIAIGEETGSLDLMLDKVADFYEKEVENTAERLKSLIEPLMIVLLAGLVGIIVTAIMVPMFEMFNQIQYY